VIALITTPASAHPAVAANHNRAPISGIARIYRSARDASVGDHLTIMLLFSAIRQRPEPVLALNQNRELSTRADDGKDRTT
jgi:hypothetical protein